jgi:hypothetical protein
MKHTKSSSKFEIFIFFYYNCIFGDLLPFTTLLLSISPKYVSEMEKMENLKVFKTFFLNSKMDKNKCPIFILKKKFQKVKTLFF